MADEALEIDHRERVDAANGSSRRMKVGSMASDLATSSAAALRPTGSRPLVAKAGEPEVLEQLIDPPLRLPGVGAERLQHHPDVVLDVEPPKGARLLAR